MQQQFNFQWFIFKYSGPIRKKYIYFFEGPAHLRKHVITGAKWGSYSCVKSFWFHSVTISELSRSVFFFWFFVFFLIFIRFKRFFTRKNLQFWISILSMISHRALDHLGWMIPIGGRALTWIDVDNFFCSFIFFGFLESFFWPSNNNITIVHCIFQITFFIFLDLTR